jgi:hypothetical protein
VRSATHLPDTLESFESSWTGRPLEPSGQAAAELTSKLGTTNWSGHSRPAVKAHRRARSRWNGADSLLDASLFSAALFRVRTSLEACPL